jgi:CheY-like chemotaxis protein
VESPVKIMVVDDDPTYAGLLADILSLYSHKVTKAGDGFEALLKLRQSPVDLIISDADMPGMNGLELHKRVREDTRLKSLPFAWNSAFREFIEIMPIEIPGLDFKFEKTMPLPNLVFFVNNLPLGSQG